MPFTDWSISPELYLYLIGNFPKDSTLLEFGSGEGTQELSKHFKMISVEDDEQWVGKYNSHYIHIPLVEYTKELFPKGFEHFGEDNKWWYNPGILKTEFEKTNPQIDLLLVDGPKGYRGGLIDYIDVFFSGKDIPIIFDDTHDKYHFKLMELVAEHLNKPYVNFIQGKRGYGIIK